MLSKEEIEKYNSMELATRIYKIQDYIIETVKEIGDMSQFKEDVMYVIHNLLDRQLSKEEQTACEIVVKNQNARLQIEKEKRLKKKIEQLEQDNYEANKIVDSYVEDRQKLIEKLEEDIKCITSSEQYNWVGSEWQESSVVEELQEILELVKGEKYERNSF